MRWAPLAKRVGEDLAAGIAASYYREGRPERELVRLGNEIDARLIVMGGRRRARLERFFGTSTAEKVQRRAGRPVLVFDGCGSQGSAVPR